MACLENLVGIKGGCITTPPTSGLYLDDVNISIGEIEAFIEQHHGGAGDFVNEKINFATRIVTAQIHTFYADRYMHNSALAAGRIGREQENRVQIAGTAGMQKGIEIEFKGDNSNLYLNLTEISLFTNTTGTINVKVFDVLQGVELETIPVTCVAGKITRVAINKKYGGARRKIHLALLYESDAVTSFNTLTSTGECGTCGTVERYQYTGNVWARAVGLPTGMDAIPNNLSGMPETGGMTVVYSLQCDHEGWVCTLGNMLALPILYKTAELIMDYAISVTGRMNSKTIIDPERMKGRRDQYAAMYADAMKSTVGRMQPPSDTQCFMCNNTVETRIILP